MVVWCDQEALVTRVRLYAATNLVSAIQQVTTTDWHCHRPRNSASPVLAHVFSILHSFPPHQQYHAMTSHKPFGRRWLSLSVSRLSSGLASGDGRCVILVGEQDEWIRDTSGLPAMTGPMFYNAVFELIGELYHR